MAVTAAGPADRAAGSAPRPWPAARRLASSRIAAGPLAAALLVGGRAVPGLPGQDRRRSPAVAAGLPSKHAAQSERPGRARRLLPALAAIFPERRRARHGGARKSTHLAGGLSNVGAHRARKARCTGRAVPPVEAAVRGAAPGAVPARLLSVVRRSSSPRSCWCTCAGACAAFAATRRCCRPSLLLTGVGLILMVSLRDPVRDNLLFVGFRAGRGRRLRRCWPCASAARLRAALRQAELRAAAGQLRAFGAAGAVRLRPGHERRQGQPVRLPAGGDHPPAAGVLPGRLFRPALGRAAPRARNAAVAGRAHPPRRYSAAGIHPAGAGVAWRCRWLFFFLQKDMGPALVFACLFLVLYGVARGSAFVPAGRPGAAGGGLRRRLLHRRAAHRARARLHVAFPVGQPGARRRSTGASLWAFATGGVVRHGHRAGRSATGARRAHRPDPLRAGRGVGLCWAWPRCSRCTRSWSSARCASRCARAPITNSSWPRAWPRPRRCRFC